MKIRFITSVVVFICLLSTVFIGTPLKVDAALSDIEVCSSGLFAGGDGATSTPWQIATPQQLANVTFCSGEVYADKHFILTDDIDLTDFENQFDDTDWMPIGAYIEPEGSTYEVVSFYGDFNGNYHIISNIAISRNEAYQALFSRLAEGSSVYDLGVENSDVTGYDAAALAGESKGTISRVYVNTGTITSTGSVAGGGIVAKLAAPGVIEDSYALAVDINTENYADMGGIAGEVEDGTEIRRVYVEGSLTNESAYWESSIGGITSGFSNTTVEINDSFAVIGVSASGSNFVGGITGKWGEFTGENNYWLTGEDLPSVCVADQSVATSSCAAVEDVNFFKNIENEPLASWDIATTDDVDYDGFNEGFPFLAWQKDGAEAETVWLIYGENGEATTTYTLSFDSKGGSSVSSITDIEEGEEVILPVEEPTYDDYNFASWNTASNGGGTNYEAGETFIMPGADTTLYAMWTADPDGPEEMTVTTQSATDVTRTSVVLQGLIDAVDGEYSIRGFEYGKTDSYGDTVQEEADITDGSYTLSVSGLKCGTLYHYRAYVEDIYGDDMTFTTSQCPSSGGGGSVSLASRSQSSVTVPVDTAVILANLRAQLATLMAQLAQMTGQTSSTDSSAVQTPTVRDLQYGDEGEDVRMLQQVLINVHAGPKAEALKNLEGAPTIYFVGYTRDALIEYQQKYGITPASGYWGEKSRVQMKSAGLSGLWW